MPTSRRRFLIHSATGLAALSLGACASTPLAPRSGPDAIVDATYTGTEGAKASGSGLPVFRSIGAALAAAPSSNWAGWHLQLRPGRYVEKLTIDRPGIRISGEDRERCILSFGAYAGAPRTGGAGTWGTEGSATLTVAAADFSAENLSIENSFAYLANDRLSSSDPGYLRGSQALALALTGSANRTRFHQVTLLGYQDTLFANAGLACFTDCCIAGCVDFIFGAGQALFERCEIRSRLRGAPDKPGYLTAASTQRRQAVGFVFKDCRLSREPGVADASIWLGRPWHPSGDPEAVGAVIWLDCWMDAHICAEGWTSMGSTTRGGQRVNFEPEDARFFESASSGPGAQPHPRRRQLSEEARRALNLNALRLG